jgi:hypothetical protein
MNEKVATWISRGILALIVVLFFALGVFGKCTGEEWLACKFTGSVFDILGTILFLAPLVVISGLVPAVRSYMDSKKGVPWNLVLFGAGVLGIILIWNL